MDPLPGSNTGFPLPPDGYLPGRARAVRQVRDPADLRRGADRVRQDREDVLLRALGRHARHHDHRQGLHRRLHPAGRRGDHAEGRTACSAGPGTSCAAAATYGGHTVACAATLANIEIIETKGLVEHAAGHGRIPAGKLEGLAATHRSWAAGERHRPAAGPVPDGRPEARKLGTFIRDWCYSNGMILRNNGDILVFAPALIITRGRNRPDHPAPGRGTGGGGEEVRA